MAVEFVRLLPIPKVEVFDTPGSTTFDATQVPIGPDGKRWVRVRMVGGGGSGGRGSSDATANWAGAGGGAGGYREAVIDVTDETDITVTVGNGGASSSGTGNDGGATSFGSFATVGGGSGGALRSDGGSAGSGEGWGVPGGVGQPAQFVQTAVTSTNNLRAAGGVSALGGAGAGGYGRYNTNSDAGAPGICIVEWYE